MANNVLEVVKPELFSPVFTSVYMDRSIAFTRTQTLTGEITQYGSQVSIPKITASNLQSNSAHPQDGTEYNISGFTTGEDVLTVDQEETYVWFLSQRNASRVTPETLANYFPEIRRGFANEFISTTEAYLLDALRDAAGGVGGGGELDATAEGELTEAVVREIGAKFMQLDADETALDNLSGREMINAMCLISTTQAAALKKNENFIRLDAGGANSLARSEARWIGSRYELGVLDGVLYIASKFLDTFIADAAGFDGKEVAIGFTFDSVVKAMNTRKNIVGDGPNPMAMVPMIQVDSPKGLDILRQGYFWSFNLAYGLKVVRPENVFTVRFEAA